MIRWLPLSNDEKRVLAALLQGAYLKAHRSLDGEKVHKLHYSENGQIEIIADAIVERLLKRNYLCSNMKFPAATYVLTEVGKAKGLAFVKNAFSPVTSQM